VVSHVNWVAQAGDPLPSIGAKVTRSGRAIGRVVDLTALPAGGTLVGADLDEEIKLPQDGPFSYAMTTVEPLEAATPASSTTPQDPGEPEPMKLPDKKWLLAQLDPDVRIWAVDKDEHLAGGAGVEAGLALLFWLLTLITGTTQPRAVTLGLAFIGTVLVLAAFELGQWDIGRHVPGFHEGLDADAAPVADTLPAGFLPGFGFGLLDLAAGTLGALLFVIAALLV
jgi:hypothetical protein